MIDMPDGRRDDRGLMGDPAAAPELEPGGPGFNRGATDLVISLSATGRTIRLFTADGDESRSSFPTRNFGIGLDGNATDR